MASLYKRADARQKMLLRMVEGAVRNAAQAHPDTWAQDIDWFARSVAKRAVGTISAQPGLLASPGGQTAGPSSSVGGLKQIASDARRLRLGRRRDRASELRMGRAGGGGEFCIRRRLQRQWRRLQRLVSPFRAVKGEAASVAIVEALKSIGGYLKRTRKANAAG